MDIPAFRFMIRQITFVCCLLTSVPLTADDWPQFLGAHRNGISHEKGLLDTWPAGGPKEVWRVPGGVGMAGLAISRGHVLTLVQKDGRQLLIALDAASGQPQWQTDLAPEYKNQQGHGPR